MTTSETAEDAAPHPDVDATDPPAVESDDEDGGLGLRALRTRQTIIDAARQLFLERGYAGTRINNITDACGISRAGFYTYFKDKRAIANVLGESAYADILGVLGEWDRISRPAQLDEIVDWVHQYFRYMDRHGAFVFSASQFVPKDGEDDYRQQARRMQMRAAFLFGVALRSRQPSPTPAPEALGLTVIAMLDRSWFFVRAQALPVSDDDMILTIAHSIMDILGGRDHDQS